MTDDAIAIVGIAIRFPDASGPDQFWCNLAAGTDSVTRSAGATTGATSSLSEMSSQSRQARGILADIELFDADFFGFPPRDAELMDPQQRLLLTLSVEALESAGYPARAAPPATGAYFGCSRSSYFFNNLMPHAELLDSFSRQISIFNEKDYATTLVAHRLNLTGPCISVATACSTSLVAIHQACRSLLQFECDMALAGGATVTVPQDAGYVYREGGILSRDGYCRAFDAAAGGTVFGSGAGVVALKRLEDAVRDGDTIHAVIRGSAVNNDGNRKVGFTAPSVQGQAEVIFEALALGGVAPETIGMVEAHGTGTVLGDPIEVAALNEVFGRGAGPGTCALGSVKTNIGHLDTAAGVAGLVKAVLALKHRQIPPSLHFETPNPQIDFESGPFYVPRALADWPAPADGTPRRAGVSSFGIGGSNAHVVLEEAPPRAPDPAPVRAEQLFVLSARSPAAVRDAARRLAAHLEAHPELAPAAVAATLQTGRDSFEHRLAVVADSTAEAARALAQPLCGHASSPQKVAFLIPGQGSQYPAMLAGLHSEPVYRAALERCLAALETPLRDTLHALLTQADVDGWADAARRLARTEITQPALFAVCYALAEQWRSWGVRPAAMLGHSVGEYVAASLSGVFEVDDAMRLVAERGRLLQALPPGAMVAVALGEAELVPLIPPALALAAVNGPHQCVVSGPVAEIAAMQEQFAVRGVRHQRLDTSHAFHSGMMEPAMAAMARCVAAVPRSAPRIPFLSNVSGDWITDAQAQSPDYWAQHLRAPVRFGDGLQALLARLDTSLLEIGPGQSLTGLARQHPAATDRTIVASARTAPKLGTARSDQAILLEAAARLWTNGVTIDWNALANRRHHRIPLPTYAFEQKSFWMNPPEDVAHPQSDAKARLLLPVWTSEASLAPAGDSRGVWLLFDDGSQLVQKLAEAIIVRSGEPLLIRAADHYGPQPNRAFSIRPDVADDYCRLLEEACGAADTPVRIVHFWSSAGLPRAALTSAFHLAQALDRSRLRTVRLALVSRAAHRVDGEIASPDAAAFSAFCATLAQEQPDVDAVHLDLPATGVSDTLIDGILAELSAATGDRLVGLREGKRWLRKLRTAATTPLAEAPIRRGGTWLITGGLGGVGRTLAEALIARHDCKVILTGRAALPPESAWRQIVADQPGTALGRRLAWLDRMTAVGAALLPCQADAASLADMGRVIERGEARFGPITGVIHAAGIGDGGLIRTGSAERLERLFVPKVDGARTLFALFGGRPLDAMVLCSSLNCFAAPIGLADYSAANAVLDAMADCPPPSAGWPVVSLAWDTWSEVGMAVEIAVSHPLNADRARAVAGGLSREAAVNAFERTLAAGEKHLVVARPSARERSAPIQDEALPQRATAPVAKRSTPEEARSAIGQIWSDLLGYDAIEPHRNFFEIGGTSVLLVELHQRLQDRFATTVRVVDLFRLPTIEDQVRHFCGEQTEDEAPLPIPTSSAPSAGGGIAIIGMSVRFPAASTLEKYWDNIANGREAIVRTPVRAGSTKRTPAGACHVGANSTCADIDLFDAGFFAFSPREAELTDPAQRLLLTCAHEALEDAGRRGLAATGTTGVFLGVATSSYLFKILQPHLDTLALDPLLITIGNDKDYCASRISYNLDLHGPSIAVNTACSTSLVAITQACRSLLAGDCDMALAGGARVQVPQDAGYVYREGGILSRDGYCRAFDAAAGGTVFGSGAGVVALKRLEDAVRDGDTIHAVIRGSAVNNDGNRKVGFTAPSVQGQAEVIFEALALGGVAPETIGMVEAHGTGTVLGDPIEVAALNEVFGRGAGPGTCALGSVKTNIGHLDTAAGVAGLVKAVLALKHRQIPPSLHFETPNPQIDFESGPFYVPRALADWPAPADGTPRRAGVSSFGIGGSNAHVVLEEAPPRAPDPAPVRAEQLFVLSARSPAAVRDAARRLAAHLEAHPELAPAAVAATLQTGRDSFEHRLAVVADSTAEAARALAQPLCGHASSPQKVAFLIPGQGSQYPAMLAGLHSEPVYRAALERCLAALETPLRDTLHALLTQADVDGWADAARRLARTEITQPALFAVCYALAEQWRSWGVRPAAMLGHSVGEYVAASLSGVFEVDDAMRLVAERGRLLQALPPGAMVAVALGEAELVPLIPPALALAAVNGPHQCVVSGPVAEIAAMQEQFAVRGVRHQRLDTSHAFHSGMMEPAMAAMARCVAAVPRSAPRIPFLSNVSGDWITDAQAQSPDYWAQHLRAPVRFGDGLQALLARLDTSLLEIGPGQSLTGLARQHPAATDRTIVASARTAPKLGTARSDQAILLEAAARLWTNGVTIDWNALANRRHHRIPLPTYAFEQKSFWMNPPEGKGRKRPAEPRATVARLRPASVASGPVDVRLRVIWERLLGTGDVDPARHFYDCGGSSLQLPELADHLASEFGITPSMAELTGALTLHEQERLVAAMVASTSAELPWKPIPLGRGPDTVPPLFLVHPIGGTVSLYHGIVGHLREHLTVYAFAASGLEAEEIALGTVEEMAAHYLDALGEVGARAPFRLAGASFGGLVAYEMARRLASDGEMACVAMFDSPCPGISLDSPIDDAGILSSIARESAAGARVPTVDRLRAMPVDALYRCVLRSLKTAKAIPGSMNRDQLERRVRVYQANAIAMQRYEPVPLTAPLLYFTAQERTWRDDEPEPAAYWRTMAKGGYRHEAAAGSHTGMMAEPNIGAVATALLSFLEVSGTP